MREKQTATIQPHVGHPFEAIVLRERFKPMHEYEIRYINILGDWDTAWLRAGQVFLNATDRRG